MSDADQFATGQTVEKVGGDYRFRGVVVAAFRKLSGQERYVVENGDGVLHIFSEANLRPVEPEPEGRWWCNMALPGLTPEQRP